MIYAFVQKKMSAKYIIGAGFGSLGIAYVCDSLVSDYKIFGGMNVIDLDLDLDL